MHATLTVDNIESIAGAEIPREDWDDFLEEFSLDHEGWIVELDGPGLEDLSSKTEHVLEMIEGDFDDDEGKAIVYLAGQAPIVFEEPVRISHSASEDMQDAQVEIETVTSTFSMRLRFPDLGQDLDTADEIGLPASPASPLDDEVGISDLDKI